MSTSSYLRLYQKARKHLPHSLLMNIMTKGIHMLVPYTRTSKLRFTEYSEEKVQVYLPNSPRVRNHIEGPHAVAIALAAETATGCVFAMGLKPGSLPLLKEMNSRFVRRCRGDVTATATLSDEARAQMASAERGSVDVTVTVRDESDGSEPAIFTMVWAWVPEKSKKPSPEQAV